MKVINTGNTYEIFDNSLQTHEALPTQTYIVRFSKDRGFYLEKYVEIEVNESKIYGIHLKKANKVIDAFGKFERNLGVILSGDKGIGKSLFAKLLSNEAMKRDIPVIVIDTYIPGIASYIERIEQEVVLLFDEFDKTFGELRAKDGEASPQTNLLSLFDGIAVGKKLFVITCNDMSKLNSYLINRPGRFHYHFRFEYPSSEEIKEYLMDKLDESNYGDIDKVIAFSKKVSLNYDCLRAIAFELSSGEKFEEAIKDLNIVNVSSEKYNITLCYDNGITATSRGIYLDLFREDEETVYLCDSKGNNFVDVDFTPTDCTFDVSRMANIIKAEDLRLKYDDDDVDCKEIVEKAKSANVECMIITRQRNRSIHYTV